MMVGEMKALARQRSGLDIVRMACPLPGAGQVLAKSLACGICGSDVHAVSHLEDIVDAGRRSGAADTINPNLPLIMGHEFCAEVLDYGPHTDRKLKPGSHVVSMPFAFSEHGPELIGFSTRFNGAFAEQFVLSEALMLEVPNGLAPTHAALTEPLAVGTHAVAIAQPTKASVSLVVGCGPIGLAVIVALKRQGFGPIIASDFSAERRAKAERLGADIVVNPGEHSPHDHWDGYNVPSTLARLGHAQIGNRNVRDAKIFECVGAPGILSSLVEKGPPTAHLIIVGACMEDDRFLPVLAINKQLRMDFVFAYSGEEFAETLYALADGQIDGGEFVSSAIPLSRAPASIEALASPCGEVKIIVEPWR